MKTLTTGKIVLGTTFVIIVIAVRLLFMLDAKIDRPSVKWKDEQWVREQWKKSRDLYWKLKWR